MQEIPVVCPVCDAEELERHQKRESAASPWITTVRYSCGCRYKLVGGDARVVASVEKECPNAHRVAVDLREEQEAEPEAGAEIR